jgi:hypothetical protein
MFRAASRGEDLWFETVMHQKIGPTTGRRLTRYEGFFLARESTAPRFQPDHGAWQFSRKCYLVAKNAYPHRGVRARQARSAVDSALQVKWAQ